MSTILNVKSAVQKIFTQNVHIPKKNTSLPNHLKRYPNMKFNRNKIINYYWKPVGKLDFTDSSTLPQKLQLRKKRIPTKLKEVMPPQHDFINFKNMSGNEILYNMSNYSYFRNGELVNSLYEFSKRVNLPENLEDQTLRQTKWERHSFVEPVYRQLVSKFPNFNLKHLIVSLLSFDNLKINDDIRSWKKLEIAFDRLLHKLKPSQIILLLNQFNKHPNRSSKEFFNKLLTIIPIHIESLKDEELLTLIKVCIKQDLVNERLFNYFIYPRIENRIKRFKLKEYLKILDLLCRLQYQEDPEFWNESILPAIFQYEYSNVEIKKLWEALLKVKVEMPNIDISKHLLLVENVIKQFDNLKSAGQETDEILLKLEQDMSLAPVSKKTMSYKETKQVEKRLNDKAALKQFMEKFNSQENEETRASEAQVEINKLLEVKDWKKAKYELNLAELEKMRKMKEEAKEEVQEATVEAVSEEATTTDQPSTSTESNKVEKKEDSYNALNTKYLEKRAKQKKQEESENKKE